MRRLNRNAFLKDDQRQLVIPLQRGADPAEYLVGFLRELIPTAAA